MGDSFDFSDLEKSCVQLCTELVGGSYGFGTGNIIYKDAFHKLILTCGHNVAVYFTPNTIVNFTVQTDESSWEPAYLITTEKYAKEELALLRTGVNVGKVSSEEVDVGGSSGEKLATRFEVWEGVLKLSEPTMCKGMDVHMSSFMSGGIVSNNSGTISQLVIPGDIFGGEIPEFVSYNIMSGLGSSGAAVVDKLGQLVAVHVSADMVDVSYDPSYQNSLAAYKLQTASGMKYGIPYFRVQRMIDFFCNSLPSDILKDKLRYLATTMVPNPLNYSPPKLKEQESSVTKLRKEQLRFGSYVCQPVIAGLGDGNKPFICTVDSIGAKELAKDFVVAGTASESLYGACESMHKPEMEPEELFETISQALQASVDRDCLSGWGAPVYLVELPKDFIVAGTASESLYGASESMYKPEMEPEELIETISRALQASVDRDCLSDWGTHVYLVFGPYFCQPVIAGLGDGNKPFICTMDSIDARELAKDFVVAGTAFESLYGACESMYKAEMEPEELFETISQALQASVDRDCLSGCGAHVYLVELAKDFVVAGTASESLYGACESLYKPEMTQPIETKEVFSKTH